MPLLSLPTTCLPFSQLRACIPFYDHPPHICSPILKVPTTPAYPYILPFTTLAPHFQHCTYTLFLLLHLFRFYSIAPGPLHPSILFPACIRAPRPLLSLPPRHHICRTSSHQHTPIFPQTTLTAGKVVQPLHLRLLAFTHSCSHHLLLTPVPLHFLSAMCLCRLSSILTNVPTPPQAPPCP